MRLRRLQTIRVCPSGNEPSSRGTYQRKEIQTTAKSKVLGSNTLEILPRTRPFNRAIRNPFAIPQLRPCKRWTYSFLFMAKPFANDLQIGSLNYHCTCLGSALLEALPPPLICFFLWLSRSYAIARLYTDILPQIRHEPASLL